MIHASKFFATYTFLMLFLNLYEYGSNGV